MLPITWSFLFRPYDIQKVFFTEPVDHANKCRDSDPAHIRCALFSNEKSFPAVEVRVDHH
jgi:hypothetical protein